MTYKNKKVSFTILLLLTTFKILTAQVSQEWVARYDGLGHASDNATKITSDNSGNIYVTGKSVGDGTNEDYATIKYNSNGIKLWAARYNGPENGDDIANSIAVDNSGNVYVTGSSYGGEMQYDYATIKYNSAGVQEWVARYDGNINRYDAAYSIAIDILGNVYVTGNSSGSDSRMVTIKYNSEGVQQWISTHSGPFGASTYATSIAVDEFYNIYVSGRGRTSLNAFNDYITIKYDDSGNELWIKFYTGTGSANEDIANSMVIDDSSNVYVTGQSSGIGNDYATIKYNSSGVLLWVARYNGPAGNNDVANSIKVDNSGNVYVTGYSRGTGTLDDYATIKYNSSGIQQWVSRYNGSGNLHDRASSLTVDEFGNVYVTGYSNDSTGNLTEYATIKYNSEGIIQWIEKYNGSTNTYDEATSIALDYIGNVYVTGNSSRTSGIAQDYVTIKYSQSTGINQIYSELPENFNLFQNYPNPFNSTTKINFSLPEKSNIKLNVYDVSGKKVADLVNENLSAGTFSYEFNSGNLPSGIYFYKIESNNYSMTKKMMVLK